MKIRVSATRGRAKKGTTNILGRQDKVEQRRVVGRPLEETGVLSGNEGKEELVEDEHLNEDLATEGGVGELEIGRVSSEWDADDERN